MTDPYSPLRPDEQADIRTEILYACKTGRSATRREWVEMMHRVHGRFAPSAPLDLTDDMRANVRDWVAALESGKFHQTRGVIARVEPNTVSYCCLGVLCATLGLTEYRDRDNVESGVLGFIAEDGERSSQSLPGDTTHAVGLALQNPMVFGYMYDGPDPTEPKFRGEWNAAALNDDLRMSFADIATVLRRWFADDNVWP